MKSLVFVISVLLISCDVFDIKTITNPQDLSKLSITYNNERITDTLPLPLSWGEVTIENFKEINIERFNEFRDSLTYPVGVAVNGWVTIFNTDNPFITTWVDTINDDAKFKYRLRYYDHVNNFYQTEKAVTIRPTTHVVVPIEVSNIEKVLESFVIDEGDTIFLCMDEFDAMPDTSYIYTFDYKSDSTRIILIEIQCD